jgi:hypothetical protein
MPRARMYHAKISVGDEREGHCAFSATVQSCWLEPYVILLEGMMNMALVNSSQGQAADSRTLAMFDFVQLYDRHAAAGLPANCCAVNSFSRARRKAGAVGATESNVRFGRSACGSQRQCIQPIILMNKTHHVNGGGGGGSNRLGTAAHFGHA